MEILELPLWRFLQIRHGESKNVTDPLFTPGTYRHGIRIQSDAIGLRTKLCIYNIVCNISVNRYNYVSPGEVFSPTLLGR